ncbi:hypothetical protein EVAR_56854_1 [Eumeta japonica]|uniref:Uncharacterized protein n=1 Tax=Eumeta variegata TaxID=151549 RepID=A0A4C1YUG0_EUMVA|nr:hypothetical protein EVAR_56854_1 [Eumeta japonica]
MYTFLKVALQNAPAQQSSGCERRRFGLNSRATTATTMAVSTYLVFALLSTVFGASIVLRRWLLIIVVTNVVAGSRVGGRQPYLPKGFRPHPRPREYKTSTRAHIRQIIIPLSMPITVLLPIPIQTSVDLDPPCNQWPLAKWDRPSPYRTTRSTGFRNCL